MVSKEKAGFTEWCEPGSGDYWQALKKAAGNASSFGCPYYYAWLGSVDGTGGAWCVGSYGSVLSSNGQSNDFVVAPAFNLDLSKVEVAGDEIIIKGSDNNDQPENQSNPIPYRSIWEYGMDLTRDGETFHLDPEMVREVLDVMLDLAKQGKTMLIVTHEMQFAKAVADKVIFIAQGKIVEEAAPDKFF